jgi:hypothetical protein
MGCGAGQLGFPEGIRRTTDATALVVVEDLEDRLQVA